MNRFKKRVVDQSVYTGREGMGQRHSRGVKQQAQDGHGAMVDHCLPGIGNANRMEETSSPHGPGPGGRSIQQRRGGGSGRTMVHGSGGTVNTTRGNPKDVWHRDKNTHKDTEEKEEERTGQMSALERKGEEPRKKTVLGISKDDAFIPQDTPQAALPIHEEEEEEDGDDDHHHHIEAHSTEHDCSSSRIHHDDGDDELFDAYKKFMADALMHESDSDSWRISSAIDGPQKHHGPYSKVHNAQHPVPVEGDSYLASMKHVINMKSKARRHHRGQQIATGVTRRFMHELHIAKENMCIHQRLLHISPSVDVDRKRHYKDFVKSRALLGKMSRYEMMHHSSSQLYQKPDWIDSF